MARRLYDPLDVIPEPGTIRERLVEAETLAQRLRVLLDLSEKLHLPVTTGDQLPEPAKRKGVAVA
ncbi:hypothetical protein J0H58_09700 [bacterium]|nr:hypothetical protein [bacterium]